MSQDSHDDDLDLFKNAMHDVKPIKKNPRVARYIAPKQPLSLRKKVILTNSPTTKQFLSDPLTCDIEAEQIIKYCSPNLPIQRFKKLKNGQLQIEATLDLHHLRRDEAKKKLTHFIEHSLHMHYRCLLIIHGKGGTSSPVGILKSHVAYWLTQFSAVLAYHSAQPQHGGRGAVYILLKNQQNS